MEKPSLEYLHELARGDHSLIDQLTEVLLAEFPIEREEYYESLKTKDYKLIGQNVHRIKHKIIILGLENAYEIANQFEHDLRDDNLDSDKVEEFEKILGSISDYLKTI
ncbi:histidine kinase [Tenacibaculum agarivorans]|uniref:histidine kinase n=1 Tax=Tenacibaculum agarivorans TaxID=1908389 RepID=UPI00094BA2BF|nr:histidine kinase [Tenacibaculum agarivorans]